MVCSTQQDDVAEVRDLLAKAAADIATPRLSGMERAMAIARTVAADEEIVVMWARGGVPGQGWHCGGYAHRGHTTDL